MKKNLLTFALLLTSSLLSAQYSWQWTVTEGEEHNETMIAIDSDADGNIYACGSFQDTIDFFGHPLASSGGIDTYVAAFDPSGNMIWVRQGSGPYEDGCLDIYVHDQFVYVTGGFVDEITFENETLISDGARDMFLIKYDLDGALLWATSDGSVTDDIGVDIAADESGNIYITGDINNVATFGTHTVSYFGFTDLFIAKYNEDGVCQWAKSAGGPIYDIGKCIEVVGEDLFIAGGFNEDAVFDTATISSVDFVDVYIAHYKTDGTFVEVVSAGGTNNEGIQCMEVDENLNVYISGWYMLDISIGNNTYNSNGSYDIFLAKYQPGTGFTWSQSIGGFGLDEPYAITSNLNDQLILTGTFEESISFGSTSLVSEGYDDGFLAKFDPDGTFDWVFQAGGSGSIDARDCISDVNGNYYMAGNFVEELVIGSQTFYPGGAYDLFLSKLGEGGASVEEAADGLLNYFEVYPNPCSDAAILKYTIEDRGLTILEVFTISGVKIKELMNEEKLPGTYEMEVDLWDLPAGVYYCVLRTGEGFYSTKLIK